MTNGSRDDVKRFQLLVAGVLTGLGLRLSPSKTWIAHPGRGIDVLRFTLKWRKIRGGGKWHGATMISDKSSRTIRQTIRNLTPRRSLRSLADVITEVNAALRGRMRPGSR